ncbi:MAG: alpha/beta fold hydrolase [Betaproteobacteria bacterium]|nr:alpha/beta fold hydrolase [Betaproteobacteria bacterium]
MRGILFGLLSAVLYGCASSPSGPGQVATETFMIPAADPGIQLHVRNRHVAGQDSYAPEKIVLMVHGATYPSETGFDIDLPGGSWMEYMAKRGYDVYSVDVRGYGRSTRPAAMEQPPASNPPFADTQDAIRDVGSAVDFILKRRGVQKINLIGWSWGTTIMGGYTAQNNAKVDRLVLYAPLWLLREPPPFSGAGAYRTVTKEQAFGRQVRSIPKDRVAEIVPAEYFDKWWNANLATDPVGASRTPPVIRAPNGVLKDAVEYLGKGKILWDPAQVRVPTFLILAEWDADTPPFMAQEVFSKLVNAPHRRLVILPEGTHAIALEKNRMQLIEQVQLFLEEGRR